MPYLWPDALGAGSGVSHPVGGVGDGMAAMVGGRFTIVSTSRCRVTVVARMAAKLFAPRFQRQLFLLRQPALGENNAAATTAESIVAPCPI
jgi:hypothetical protein